MNSKEAIAIFFLIVKMVTVVAVYCVCYSLYSVASPNDDRN